MTNSRTVQVTYVGRTECKEHHSSYSTTRRKQICSHGYRDSKMVLVPMVSRYNSRLLWDGWVRGFHWSV